MGSGTNLGMTPLHIRLTLRALIGRKRVMGPLVASNYTGTLTKLKGLVGVVFPLVLMLPALPWLPPAAQARPLPSWETPPLTLSSLLNNAMVLGVYLVMLLFLPIG